MFLNLIFTLLCFHFLSHSSPDDFCQILQIIHIQIVLFLFVHFELPSREWVFVCVADVVVSLKWTATGGKEVRYRVQF